MIVRFSLDKTECLEVEKACVQRQIDFKRFIPNMSDYIVDVGSYAGIEGLDDAEKARIKTLRKNLMSWHQQVESIEAFADDNGQVKDGKTLATIKGWIESAEATVREAEEKSRAIMNQQKEVTA